MQTRITPFNIRYWLPVCLFLASLNLFGQGHYLGSSYNPNDYFVPPSSGWVLSLYYSYAQLEYFNDSGDKTDKIEISQSPPFSVELGQKVKTNSIIPMAIYFGKGKIMNARWGVLALPMLNNPNANIALDFYIGQDTTINENININSFGLGDFYVQPVWLTWEKKKWAATFSYGFWLPTGKYETNDPENIGLGYWSHNFRVAGKYKPNATFGFTGAATVELNSSQDGVDFTEASHFTLDYGASYTFAMGHEVGFMGFAAYQLGADTGEKAFPPKDQIYGLGAYGSYYFIPGRLGALARFTQNFGVRNRYGGLGFQIGINYLLLK